MPSDVCSGDAHGLDIVKRLIHSSSFGDPSPNHLDAKNTPELELARHHRDGCERKC